MILRCFLLMLFLPVAFVQADDSFYLNKVKPLFAQNCVGCHGPEKQKAGLRLDYGSFISKGGNSGLLLQAGNPSKSRLVHVLEGSNGESRMPPEPKKPLSLEQKQILEKWIQEGAKIPEGEKGELAVTKKASNHWAFQPIRKPRPPLPCNLEWAKNAIDLFVMQKLDAEKMQPNSEADSLLLLRRVSLDLTGLPPTPSQVREYLLDGKPGAYERAVDRLFASPRYGERWGRLWLDQARYADSDGYEKDTGRPFAWRYRHWVIESLNEGLPLNQFVTEQLAGDLLPGSTAQQKVATGFHRNTLTNKEGGVDQEQFRVEAVVDRVNTTAKVFLGLTFGCAQCHDHKYDPFSQRDYFQFLAFFNSDDEVNLPAPELPEEQEANDRLFKAHQAKVAPVKKSLEERKTELLKGIPNWESTVERKGLPDNIRSILGTPFEKRGAKQQKALQDYRTTNDEKLKSLEKQLADLEKAAPKPTMAQTVAMGKGRKTHVHIRGDFLRPGVEVATDTPAVLPGLKREQKADRLALANWITSESNPLFRRVMANWVWHKFFGRGLVATLEDFGTQGEKSSHPELLDWLASSLSENDWNLKDFQRLIVTSATYRQSSQVDAGKMRQDPYNIFLARQSRVRLEAEGVRDVFLQASGLLDQRIGGASARPPQPPGISELTYANAARWNESTGMDRYRRGMYTWFQRTSPYPSLMLFDAPDSNLACVRRERSNTPLQALALLNDVAFYECARELGIKLSLSSDSLGQKIDELFLGCTGRLASASEKQYLLKLKTELEAHYSNRPEQARQLVGDKAANAEKASWVALGRMVLNLDEVIVRE